MLSVSLFVAAGNGGDRRRQAGFEALPAHFLPVAAQIKPPRPKSWHALVESVSLPVARSAWEVDLQFVPPRPKLSQFGFGVEPNPFGRCPLGDASQ